MANKYQCARCDGTGEELEATTHGKTYDGKYEPNRGGWTGVIYDESGKVLSATSGLVSDIAVFRWAKSHGVISRLRVKMTDFDVWNVDQPCRSVDAVAALKAQWVKFEQEGFDESEITTLMDGWVKSEHRNALGLLPRGKWCACGFPHETGGPCWECRARTPRQKERGDG